MEPNPPYLQHNHRYVPCSPNPPPPRPPMVHNSPNIYGPHHHLPPPPPPVPPSRHPLPAQSPPLPPPNISYQFSVRPNRNPNPNYPMEDTHHPRSTMKHHFPDVARSPRLSFGVPVDEDRPHHPNRYQHIYAESDPSWDGRAYPVGILDREPHQLQSDRGQFDQRAVSPYRPIEKIRQKFDGDVRFREGFERNPRREDFKRDRGNRNSHFDSSSRGWSEHGAASSRTYESNYDNRSHRRDSSKTENHRWAHTREVVREGNGVRRGLGTHEYYNSELERYDNKGGREVNYEFDHTPKKQMQKKSVLLRIQKPKPSYRNREEDVSIFYDYVNDTTSIPFRGMEQHEYTDRGVEENTREGSPVELDVSFKSNSLVAKAVVPPSSFAVVTGANFAPRNSKIRKVEVSEKDCSNKSTVKLDRALCASKNTSTSNPVANPGIDNEHKSNSEPSSLELDVSRGKRKVERSSKVMQSGSSGKTNSTMVAKKKKIVKKVVKKVLNPRSRLLSSQPKEKLDEPVKADTSTLCQPLTSATDNFSTPSGENIAAVGLVSVHHTEFQPCPNDASVCGAYERVDGSPKTVVPEEVTGDVNCGGLNLQKSKRKWDDLTPRLDSSKDKHFKFDENSANADNSAHGLQTLYNPDKDCTGLQSEKMLLFSVEGFGKQGCQNESSVLLDSSSAAVSSEVMLSVGSIIDSSLLYSEKNMTQEHLMNTSSTNHELNSAVVIDRSSINSLGRSVNTDFETVGNVSCQTGTCQIDKTDDDGTVNGFSKTVSSVDDIIASKSLEETRIGYSRIATECCDQIASTIYSSRNSCFSSDETNLDTGDDIGNHPYQGGITILADGGVTVSSLDDPNLADGSEARSPNNQREVGSTHLHMLRSGLNNLHFAPINVVRSVPYVDTNLSLYFREPEVTISHVLAMGLGLQRCADGFGVIRGSSSIEGLLEAKTSSSNEVNVGLDEVPKKNEDDKRLSAGYMVPSGPITSAINEEPLADSSTSLVEEPSEIFGSSIQPEEVVAVSSMDTVCTADFSPRQEGITVGGSSKDVNSARDTFTNDGSNVYSYCKTEKFGIANMEYVCPSVLECERVTNVASVENNHLINIMSVENNEGEKTNLDADDAQIMICSKPAQIHIPAELHCLAVNQRNPHTEWRDESYLHHEDYLPSVSNHPSLLAHDEPVSTPYCNEELMDIVPEVMDIVPEVSDDCSPVLTKELDSSFRRIGKDNIGQDDTNRDKKPVTTGGSNLSTQSSHSIEANIYSKRNPVMEKNQSSNGKALSSQESIITTHIRYPLSAESHGKKIQSSCAPPRIPGYSTAVYNASRSKSSSTHVAQPRTWHRTTTSAYPLSKIKPISSTVPPQRQFPTRSSKLLNNSYIWKGNSFVRKSPPVTVQSRGLRGLSSSVYQLNSLGTDEVKKSSGSESRVNVTDTSSTLGTGVLSASFERPKIPPSTITKIPNGSTTSSGVHPSSPLAETSNVSNETTSVKFAETNDALSAGRDLSKISETPVYITGSTNNSNNRNELSDGNLTSLNVKSITYVKRKSNQLIATSSPTDLCAHNAENTVTASSDGYYKRSRNQLIRTPLEGHAKRTVAMPDADLISKGLTTSVVLPGRSFGRRRNQKVLTKHGKSSNFSLVWRLGGAQLSNKNGSSLKHQVLPHLPWKRATYSRSFMQSPVSISNNSSLSTISRKLLTLRKRNTVYTRSRNGYSLRKFKVLSVGGCNLKWSKSIDRHSKKANEEATLAVAAVERERREQNGAACTVSGTKSRSHSSHKSYNNGGERIFRIGSLRYKMDSSRRTLQRISDNESSCSAALQTEKIMKNPYVPRRLVIDNNEYVRIGSGNQLIRDPKRRTRVLASEKVRWSLHTVRSRLAKKRKYCQFFTRFGRCNKDDGKCPYIHDSSKIAVCTKFLNGLCHNSNCKLTHKVIPERMPDCSYFLEGLCMNKSCPYRHVHVNPNAPTCEGFLRGYCADDNECRKKHSYLCPTFEATGSCPLGSKCKLHHPKNRIKGKKGKRSIEQKNARGRYFGSMRFDIFDSGKATFEMHSVQDGDDVPVEGKFTDFISIDDSDEDGECNDSTTEQIASSGSGPSDLRIDDLDELIKPIRIMNKNLTT